MDPRNFDSSYDVLIVGGRAAGASLAARLGSRGLRVLVVDRVETSSQPAVPSSPVLYPSSLRELDGLGVDERLFGSDENRLRGIVLQFGDFFKTSMQMPEVHGRDYFYSIERPVFDHALWRHLERYPSVTARAGFSVTELLRDGSGRVVGVVGHAGKGAPERIGARCVVGADGRYSPFARMAGARVREEQVRYMSAVYFADWDDLTALEGLTSRSIQIFTTGRGRDVLIFPLSWKRATLAAYLRADQLPRGFDPQTFYLEYLKSFPPVEAALRGARQVSRVVGLKRVENGYREAGGPGWVLVGDALHYKDPVDGQGIYDALLEGRLLAELLVSHLTGNLSWEALVATYDRQVLAETHPMFQATMQRVKQQLYDAPSPFLIRTLLRWMMTDPDYQRRFLLFLGRAIPPAELVTPAFMAGVLWRGLRRDLFGRRS